MSSIDIHIKSEVDTLQKVLVHTPGTEMNLLNSHNTQEFIHDLENKTFRENQDFLLWDDTIYLSGAVKEHQEMCRVINTLAGGEACIQFRDLFKDTHSTWDNGGTIANLLFTRDLAFSFGGTTVVSWNSKSARNKENELTKKLFSSHPSLHQNKIIFFHDQFPDLTVEGGDVMIFNSNTILVGLSERTNKESVERLIPYFLDEGFSSVVGVCLPKKRTFMHLDTVLTKIDKHEYLVYDSDEEIKSISFSESNTAGEERVSRGLGALVSELDDRARLFRCSEKEQWTCGSNALAVSPGKILLYERNEITVQRLVDEGGYRDHTPDEIISGKFNSSDKIVVKINGSELSRGRGGARCMTMPLVRG